MQYGSRPNSCNKTGSYWRRVGTVAASFDLFLWVIPLRVIDRTIVTSLITVKYERSESVRGVSPAQPHPHPQGPPETPAPPPHVLSRYIQSHPAIRPIQSPPQTPKLSHLIALVVPGESLVLAAAGYHGVRDGDLLLTEEAEGESGDGGERTHEEEEEKVGLCGDGGREGAGDHPEGC